MWPHGLGHGSVCAEAGHDVIVREVNDAALTKGLGSIEKFLGGAAEKGKMTAEKKAEIMGRLEGTTKLEDLAPCDLVIEAVVEHRAQARDVRRAQQGLRQRHDLRFQHVLALHHRDGRGLGPGRPLRGPALLQSRSPHEAKWFGAR